MKNIKHFLKEQAEGEGTKLKHIEHLEDLPLNSGKQGLEQSVGALRQVQQHIKAGRKNSDLTMKHDGSPSLVYGHHPDTGKFFVASKSAFNVTPKINYTEDDIQKNHGHAPGLVEKLKSALQQGKSYLLKVLRMRLLRTPGGVPIFEPQYVIVVFDLNS
jgi:hypothetical protein